MKHLLLTLWGLFGAFGMAQNAMFLPFGQTTVDVMDYLDTRDYVHQVVYEADSGYMHLSLRQQEVQYFFDDEVLFAVEDRRVITDKKEADGVIKACLDFMAMEERRVRTLSSQSSGTHYAAVGDDRIMELIVVDLGTRKAPDIRIRLKVTSRLYGPRMQTEAFAAQVARRGL